MTEEKRKRWTMTEWISQFHNRLQFLHVSHSVGADTAALQPATDSDSNGDDDADEQSTASTATTSPGPDRVAAEFCVLCFLCMCRDEFYVLIVMTLLVGAMHANFGIDRKRVE